jgi:hypothetical protein
MRSRVQFNTLTWVWLPAFLVLVAVWAQGAEPKPAATPLDHGFNLLYNLSFDQAHQVFVQWEQNHPADPMGPASEAAGLLFSEFHRLGVLESQFYADDKAFDNRQKFTPDNNVRGRFDDALSRTETLAQACLQKDSNDQGALFAMTLRSGLKADYEALIEKNNFGSLRYTKEGNIWAGRLLAVNPQFYDAHLAVGASKYIVGSMPAPVRWLVRLGGVPGDKQAGIQELQVTAEQGRFLAPFARILLAIAYVREKDVSKARAVLSSLKEDFPQNPLFEREIAHLDSGH